MAQQTAINGVRYSFTDLKITASTAPNFGGVDVPVPKGIVQSINYEASQDAGIVQGNQIGIVGRTNGYGTGTGSMELLVSEADDFFLTITAGGFFPIMSVFFDLTVSYSVNGIDVRVDTLRGIKITKIGSNNTKGSEATTKSCDLSIAEVILNGVSAYGDPLTF